MKPMFTILVVSLALLVAIVLVSSPSPFSQSSLPSNSPLSVFSSLCFSSCFCFINWVIFFPCGDWATGKYRKMEKTRVFFGDLDCLMIDVLRFSCSGLLFSKKNAGNKRKQKERA